MIPVALRPARWLLALRPARWLLAAVVALVPAIAVPPAAAAPRCSAGGVEVDLAGSGDTAAVSGHAAAACRSGARSRATRGQPRPFFTYELACSVDRARAAQGLCSTTLCTGGLFFAFRTLHRPEGGTEPAGSTCVSLAQARASPALTAADVFAAIRRVRLPPGTIRIAPSGRGLANLPTRLWLVGGTQPPVDLQLAGSVIHADFQPVSYRWTAMPKVATAGGDPHQPGGLRAGPAPAAASTEARGAGTVRGTFAASTQPDGAPPTRTVAASTQPGGRDGASAIVFTGRGEFVVSVLTTWSAAAFLDGRYVGQVDDLISTTSIAYPVAELRTALSD
jgi:hypothetical protein